VPDESYETIGMNLSFETVKMEVDREDSVALVKNKRKLKEEAKEEKNKVKKE
jgi:hypothetical protein